jgi:hypothetical protein
VRRSRSSQSLAPSLLCRDGKKLAVAVIHRDLEGLRAEVEFERVMARNNSSIQAVQGSASPGDRAGTATGGS